MKRVKNKYLTMEEKKELALRGERVPVCIGNSNQRNGFIAKIRSIYDGSLKNKKLRL